MPVSFVFERALFSRHFLLGKGHPMRKLLISTLAFKGHQGGRGHGGNRHRCLSEVPGLTCCTDVKCSTEMDWDGFTELRMSSSESWLSSSVSWSWLDFSWKIKDRSSGICLGFWTSGITSSSEISLLLFKTKVWLHGSIKILDYD